MNNADILKKLDDYFFNEISNIKTSEDVNTLIYNAYVKGKIPPKYTWVLVELCFQNTENIIVGFTRMLRNVKDSKYGKYFYSIVNFSRICDDEGELITLTIGNQVSSNEMTGFIYMYLISNFFNEASSLMYEEWIKLYNKT